MVNDSLEGPHCSRVLLLTSSEGPHRVRVSDVGAPGASPTDDGVRSFCRGKIACVKIPKSIPFVKDVPRTPDPHGDKVRRGKRRDQALEEP